MKIRSLLIWSFILGIHFIGYPMSFSHNSYPLDLKEYLLNNNCSTGEIHSEETLDQKYTGLLTALRSFIYFLGREYLSYKLEDIFEYLENKLVNHTKIHFEKTWITHESQRKSNQEKIISVFHDHYLECNICQGVAHLIMNQVNNEEIRNNMERFQMQINNINSITEQKINYLESLMNQRLKEIDRRFISMEHEVQQIKDKMIDFKTRLDGLEGDYKDFFKYAMPRIAIFQNKIYNENIFFDFRNNYSKFNIEIITGVPKQKISVVLVSKRQSRLAEELSSRYKLPLVDYKTTGLYGFEHFDIILIL